MADVISLQPTPSIPTGSSGAETFLTMQIKLNLKQKVQWYGWNSEANMNGQRGKESVKLSK